jgi:hypothetical protein
MAPIERTPIPPELESEILRLRNTEKKSQPAIVELLRARGVRVSQSTISRFLAAHAPRPVAGSPLEERTNAAPAGESLAAPHLAPGAEPPRAEEPARFDPEPFGGEFPEGEPEAPREAPPRAPELPPAPRAEERLEPPPRPPPVDLNDSDALDQRLRQIRRLLTDELFGEDPGEWIKLAELERKWLDLKLTNAKGKKDGSRDLESFTAECFRAEPPPPLE